MFHHASIGRSELFCADVRAAIEKLCIKLKLSTLTCLEAQGVVKPVAASKLRGCALACLRRILVIDLNDLQRAEVYCRLVMARHCCQSFCRSSATGVRRSQGTAAPGREGPAHLQELLTLFHQHISMIQAEHRMHRFSAPTYRLGRVEWCSGAADIG